MRYIAPLVIGLLGTAILVWLGVWQLQRLEWKETILAEIDARLAMDPVPLPQTPDRESDRFRPVTVAGTATEPMRYVFANVPGLGVRLRVIQPLELADGRRVLLERGVISTELPELPAPTGPVAVTGMMHWPAETDVFTPDPDPQTGVLYARDVDALAADLATEAVLVVADTVDPPDPLILPVAIDPAGIANDHLEYAVTWFGLAAVWVAMTGLWLRRIARARLLER